MYSREEVFKTALEYFKGNELAANVWTDKYALRTAEGGFMELTPADTHRRLAREFARIEQKYVNPLSEEEIYTWLSDWWIIPQGSPMSGIGNPFQLQSISNCFVIDSAQDSYGGIFRADQEQAQIMKRRGGVGHDISNIRPRGLSTSNAARTTDGIGVFMDRFSNTTREVAQNGRRGALMLTISSRHPEIRTFINIKKDKKRVTGANISIRVDDEFMRAVKEKRQYKLQWPVNSNNPLIEEWVNAEEIWNEMMQAAWDSAEPGILFWDTVIRNSPADCYADLGFESISTNPCGELILPAGDSCRLMLMNLTKFVIDPYTSKARFDYDNFAVAVRVAQRLMDDLVDLELEIIEKIIKKVESDPEDEFVKAIELNLWKKIYKVTADGRRTGLGETGLGDTIAMLGVCYGSDESIALTEKIHKTLAVNSYASSVHMARERGAFPVFELDREKDHVFISKVIAELSSEEQEMYRTYGRRNIANLTVAPAGSMSIMARLGFFGYGTTSGCEPAFRVQYTRRKKIMNDGDRVDFVDDLGDKWQEFTVFHLGHQAWAEVNGKDPIKDLEESPYWKATASDIDWVKKVDIQAAAQKWVDHSISNTTNVPENVDVELVKKIYMRGWETGCKGITIYRDGSRSGVLVTNTKPSKNDEIQETDAPKRPMELPCDIHRAKVKGQEYLILVGLLHGKPYEIFCGLAENMEVGKKEKHGTLVKAPKKSSAHYNLITEAGETLENVVDLFDNPDYGAFTRILSASLRHGVPVKYIVEQLRKDKHSTISSFSSVIARVLAKSYIADGTKVAKKCPDCNSSNLSYLQGCVSCLDCGSSKCG